MQTENGLRGPSRARPPEAVTGSGWTRVAAGRGFAGRSLWLLATLLSCGAAEFEVPVPGVVFELGDRRAVVRACDALPFVDSEYSRRYRFDSHDNPKLAELRRRHRLDDVIAPGRDEFERQVLLLDWAHRQFPRFGRPSTNAHGALAVLDAVREGHTFFCAQYAEVLVSAAASLGWVDRPLALRRHQGVARVGGSTEHSVTEIWSNQHRKWVMLDPTANLHVQRDGIPLNAQEIRTEWFHRDGARLELVIGREQRRYRKADLPVVLARFEGFGELAVHPDELDKYGFIGFIPNTDLMDAGYDYGGMFIVQDALCDGTSWHRRRVPEHPATDPYFPVGQAAPRLGVEAGQLRVRLATLTPNFDRFEIRTAAGPWVSTPAEFVWSVQPGDNRLVARTVNRFGVTGPVSTLDAEVIVRAAPLRD